MKSIDELEQIFSILKTENTQNHDFSRGKDWKVVFFVPLKEIIIEFSHLGYMAELLGVNLKNIMRSFSGAVE